MDDLTLIVFIGFVSIATALLGYVVGYNSVQQNAVDQKAAKWVVDNRGNVSLEWIKGNHE